MTCNDAEPNYRIGKRVKSLTSKNLYKTLNINKLQTKYAILSQH